VDKNIVYRDNKSAILLETNGKRSSGKQTQALNKRYFFITDQVEKGNAQIEHCGTDNMVGDFFTKPLPGEKFLQFRDNILGCKVTTGKRALGRHDVICDVDDLKNKRS
jgi:hypothetical protein